jgi:hypothetical protein
MTSTVTRWCKVAAALAWLRGGKAQDIREWYRMRRSSFHMHVHRVLGAIVDLLGPVLGCSCIAQRALCSANRPTPFHCALRYASNRQRSRTHLATTTRTMLLEKRNTKSNSDTAKVALTKAAHTYTPNTLPSSYHEGRYLRIGYAILMRTFEGESKRFTSSSEAYKHVPTHTPRGTYEICP